MLLIWNKSKLEYAYIHIADWRPAFPDVDTKYHLLTTIFKSNIKVSNKQTHFR